MRAQLTVLAIVNDKTEGELVGDVGLAKKVAHGIATHGSNFATLAELDAIPYVCPGAKLCTDMN